MFVVVVMLVVDRLIRKNVEFSGCIEGLVEVYECCFGVVFGGVVWVYCEYGSVVVVEDCFGFDSGVECSFDWV